MGSRGSHLSPSLLSLFLFSSLSQARMGTPVSGCAGGVPVYGRSCLIWSGNCTPHFWHHQARASGVRGWRGVRLAPGPTPGWDQPLLLVPAAARPATRRRLPADAAAARANGIGIACRTVGSPCRLSAGHRPSHCTWMPFLQQLCLSTEHP